MRKIRHFAVDFRARARNSWALRGGLLLSNQASFEGRRGEQQGHGAKVVQLGVDRLENVENCETDLEKI
jgi:hypothetical protein